MLEKEKVGTVTFNEGDTFGVEEDADGKNITVTIGKDSEGKVTSLDEIKDELAKYGVTIEGTIEDVSVLANQTVTIQADADAKK